MKREHQKFFNAFKQFRKLHFGSLTPNLNHTDFGILMRINCLNHGLEPEMMPDCKVDIVNHTSEHKKVKVSEVANNVHMNATAVSRSLKSLEERGYIIRTVSKTDRRITYVDITEAGIAAIKESEAVMDDFADAVFTKLGDDEITELTNYLNRLYSIAEEEIELRKKKSKSEKNKSEVSKSEKE